MAESIETRRTADRERKRKSRFLALKEITGGGQALPEMEIVTSPDLGDASGIRGLLNFAAGKVIHEAHLSDAATVARAVGTLAGAALKLLEVADLVERLESLERQMSEKGGNAE
jgi:hypothetical protein